MHGQIILSRNKSGAQQKRINVALSGCFRFTHSMCRVCSSIHIEVASHMVKFEMKAVAGSCTWKSSSLDSSASFRTTLVMVVTA